MTIDEEIKHHEEVAEELEEEAVKGVVMIHIMNKCIDYAKECRQIAKWLKALKALRDFANFVAESVMDEEFEENSGFYAEVYCRKLHKMGFIEAEGDKWIFNTDEVNVDEKL